ncbi:MAG: ribonuclease J [bacterium]|nr:ribonuclease J [bacterium]
MNQPYRPHSGNRQNNRQGNRHSGRPSNSGKLFFRSSSSQDGDSFRGPRTPRANFMPRNNEENAEQQAKTPQKNCLRIIPLGGLGEVGRNMTVIEWRDYDKDDRDILLIDAGVRFPEEDMPGIDLLIPNIKYLEDKTDKISGLIFTHGHFDHIGALPYMLERLENPMIYAAPLTKGLVIKRHEEFKQLPKLMIDEIRSGDKRKIGVFEVEFIHINHSIPDDMALLIKTPVGNIMCTSDFKFDHNPVIDKPAEIDRLKKIGDDGLLLVMSDSTGAEEPGHSISESDIQDNLEKLIKEAPGRIIVGMFASAINRVQQIIAISEKYNRKVVVEGFSMKAAVEVSKVLGYIKTKKGTLISASESNKYPDSKITVLGTGGQGEENAVLMRLATHRHKQLELKKGDTIIFSSSIIPGNERTIQHLKDNLLRHGVKVYNYKMLDIHAGGHGQQDDLMYMLELVRPKFLMPVHGQLSMLFAMKDLGLRFGMPEENIVVVENGNVVRVTADQISVDKKSVPAEMVMVDGLGVGDVGSVVLRDRQMLAEDGMFMVVAVVDSKSGRVRGSPDIISRGFIYLRDNKQMLLDARMIIRKVVEGATASEHPFNDALIKEEIKERLGQFLFQKTHRRPMILPVLIQV